MNSIKTAQTTYNVADIIKNRWSTRSFSQEALSTEELNTLFEAASWSASGGNSQPWMFVYAHKGSELFNAMVETLSMGNRIWAHNAAALVLILAKVKNSEGKPIRMALHDAGSAMTTLLLQATHMDIYGHAMAGYDMAQTKALLAVPDEWEPTVYLALGRLGTADSLPNEDLQQRESTPRTRKALNEFVFDSSPFVMQN